MRLRGTPGGLKFVDPFLTRPSAANGFVFPDAARFRIAEAAPTFLHANVSAETLGDFDITFGQKAARVWFEIDPATSPDSFYEIRFDRDLTVFAARTGDDPIIPVTLESGFIRVVPEPSGVVLLGFGALVSRRRR